jgi:hypothetical protein
MILLPTHVAPLLQRNGKDFLRLVVGDMTNLGLLSEGDIHRQLVIWATEGTGQGLERLQNAKSGGMHIMMTRGGVDRHHLEQHLLDLLQALLLDDLLHQSILIALVWPDLDLDHRHIHHLDLMMHVHRDLHFYDLDLLQNASGRRPGSSPLLAATLIAPVHRPLHVKIIVEPMDHLHPPSLLRVLVDIAMAITLGHLQVDRHAATVKHRRCPPQSAPRTPLFLCLPTIGQTPQSCQLLLALVALLLVVLMGLHEIFRLHLPGEPDLLVHQQDQQFTT